MMKATMKTRSKIIITLILAGIAIIAISHLTGCSRAEAQQYYPPTPPKLNNYQSYDSHWSPPKYHIHVEYDHQVRVKHYLFFDENNRFVTATTETF